MRNQPIAEFLKSGGKVTICPASNTIPRKPRPIPLRKAPANGHDELCKQSKCPNVGRCLDKCAPLMWINGTTPQRECQIDMRHMDQIRPDYKQTISELANIYDWPTLLDDVRAIKDLKQRAVFAMLLCDINQVEIADLMGINRKTLHRFLQRVKIRQ